MEWSPSILHAVFFLLCCRRSTHDYFPDVEEEEDRVSGNLKKDAKEMEIPKQAKKANWPEFLDDDALSTIFLNWPPYSTSHKYTQQLKNNVFIKKNCLFCFNPCVSLLLDFFLLAPALWVISGRRERRRRKDRKEKKKNGEATFFRGLINLSGKLGLRWAAERHSTAFPSFVLRS